MFPESRQSKTLINLKKQSGLWSEKRVNRAPAANASPKRSDWSHSKISKERTLGLSRVSFLHYMMRIDTSRPSLTRIGLFGVRSRRCELDPKPQIPRFMAGPT